VEEIVIHSAAQRGGNQPTGDKRGSASSACTETANSNLVLKIAENRGKFPHLFDAFKRHAWISSTHYRHNSGIFDQAAAASASKHRPICSFDFESVST
jgi:hypothetical protein